MVYLIVILVEDITLARFLFVFAKTFNMPFLYCTGVWPSSQTCKGLAPSSQLFPVVIKEILIFPVGW